MSASLLRRLPKAALTCGQFSLPMSRPVSYSAALRSQAHGNAPGARANKASTVPAPRSTGDHGVQLAVQSKGYTAAEYQRNTAHETHTGQDESHYVLTLKISRQLHEALTALRDKHFPKQINKLQAHICLFRALPGSQLPVVEESLSRVCNSTRPFEIAPRAAFRMKMGVGVKIGVGTEEAKRVHEELRHDWAELGWLSDQDRGSFSAHVTVQNKVEDASVVDKALKDVEQSLREMDRRRDLAEGLVLWRYVKGYWHFEKDFAFQRS